MDEWLAVLITVGLVAMIAWLALLMHFGRRR